MSELERLSDNATNAVIDLIFLNKNKIIIIEKKAQKKEYDLDSFKKKYFKLLKKIFIKKGITFTDKQFLMSIITNDLLQCFEAKEKITI